MNRMNNEKKQFGNSVELIPKRITALTVLALLCIINASHVPVVFTVSQINIRNSPLTANTAPGIIITGANWTNCGWVNGSGTLADPCVLQNLVIISPITADCISISNSNAYFQIRNCTLENAFGRVLMMLVFI